MSSLIVLILTHLLGQEKVNQFEPGSDWKLTDKLFAEF